MSESWMFTRVRHAENQTCTDVQGTRLELVDQLWAAFHAGRKAGLDCDCCLPAIRGEVSLDLLFSEADDEHIVVCKKTGQIWTE